jgi:hypothetical protein
MFQAGSRTINWALVSPGSDSTASVSAARLKMLGFSDIVAKLCREVGAVESVW